MIEDKDIMREIILHLHKEDILKCNEEDCIDKRNMNKKEESSSEIRHVLLSKCTLESLELGAEDIDATHIINEDNSDKDSSRIN